MYASAHCTKLMSITPANYCPAIYKGLYISNEPNNEARVGACCVNKTGLGAQVINFHTDEYLNQQRRAFELGERPASCAHCWNNEDTGLPSRRRDSISPHIGSEDPYAVELLTLHYNVPPLCNAKCITCGSHWSSAWAQEDEQFDFKNVRLRNFNQIYRSTPTLDLDYTKLRQIYFNGGEPFLSKHVNQILSQVKQQQGTLNQIGLVISTNSSVMPTQEQVALWNECRTITLLCSIDAVDTQFEYIRYPLVWDQVQHNVGNFGALFTNNLTVMLSPNVGVHNALEYPKLLKWFQNLQTSGGYYLIAPNPSPTFGRLEFSKVTANVKEAILSRIPAEPEFYQVRMMIQQSASADDNTKWQNHLKFIDDRRGLNWRSVFPELAEIVALNDPLK